MSDALIFNTVKEYPTMIKVIVYLEPFKAGGSSGKKKRVNKRKQAKALEESIIRTKTTVRDICLCNEFDLFCTFTFDPKRYNCKSMEFCKIYMNNWTHNAKSRHSPNLKYLIVPEKHKSGAIHFHALIKGYEGRLKDSKHTSNGRTVYNIPHWHFGFSTAVKIDNQEAVACYVSKYITKDMLTFSGNKRYYCSQNLLRPIVRQNQPLSFLQHVHSLFHVQKDREIYTISKKDIDSYTPPMLF